MREIKFRAWDTKNKVYYYGNTDPAVIQGLFFLNPRYKIEQFTGLHDCDGKEIYDGDIVEIIMPCGTPNEITDTVQYNDSYGCFFLRTRYTSVCDLIQSDYSFKVIGNIHEAH